MKEINIHTQKWNSLTHECEIQSVPIKAHVFGDWAAHKAYQCKGYRATHVPTGIACAGREVPKTIGEAKRLAKHYNDNNHKFPETGFTFGEIPDREWVKALSAIFRDYIDNTQGVAP
jgi:hypothetical protein